MNVGLKKGNDDNDDEKQFKLISLFFLITSSRYSDKVSSSKPEVTKLLNNEKTVVEG